MSSTARQDHTVGEIVNLMSIDAQRLMDLVTYVYALYSFPLQITLALYFLHSLLGPSIFAGFSVLILMIPLNLLVGIASRSVMSP